jgi:hypothetical protein
MQHSQECSKHLKHQHQQLLQKSLCSAEQIDPAGQLNSPVSAECGKAFFSRSEATSPSAAHIMLALELRIDTC